MNARPVVSLVAACAAALACAAPAVANPPVASFTVAPEAPAAGQTVTFDASASTADHPARRSYRWFIDKPLDSTDHLPVTSDPVLTQTFTAGTHTVDLIVADEMCIEPPAGNNCYSAKTRKTITVAAAPDGGGGGGTTPPPTSAPSDPRLQLGDAGDSLQAGTAAANLQVGGGGRETQRGNAGNDVQLPDARQAQICALRAQVIAVLTVLQRRLGRLFVPYLTLLLARVEPLFALLVQRGCPAASHRAFSGEAIALASAGPVDDRLFGGPGDDVQFAGPGNDVLDGGPGRDLMLGDAGSDTMRSRDSARDVVRCGSGKDSVIADRRDAVAKDCEKVSRK